MTCDDTCLVTFFIDINRSEWTSFQRSSDKYFQNFEPYLDMNNELIVFIDEKWYEKLTMLTTEHNKKNITIIKLNDEFLNNYIRSWKYISIEQSCMDNPLYKYIIKHRIHHPENSIAIYNVLQHCKTDFIKYVIDNNLTSKEYIAWTDFGYFMDSSKIPKIKLLTSKNLVVENKITYSLINDTITKNDIDLIYGLCNAPEIIGGFFFIGNKQAHLKHNETYHNILNNLFYKNGIVDDDQHIVLHCYLSQPQDYHLIKLGWHNIYTTFCKE